MSTHAQLCYLLAGIPTRWTTTTPRILAVFWFLSSYQRRVLLADSIIRLFGLGWRSFLTLRMGKSLPVHTHSLTHTQLR